MVSKSIFEDNGKESSKKGVANNTTLRSKLSYEVEDYE